MFRDWWNKRQTETKRQEKEVRINSILKNITESPHNFTEAEQVEILKSVLMRFKQLKNSRCTELKEEARSIETALKELE